MDLTSHVPNDKKPKVGNVIVSPGCEMYLLHCAQALEVEDTSCLPTITAKVIADFVTSDYWRSPWWSSQKVHSIVAFGVSSAKSGNVTSVPARLLRTDKGWTLLAPDEADLPEGYFDQRVVEEVKVEHFPECLPKKF